MQSPEEGLGLVTGDAPGDVRALPAADGAAGVTNLYAHVTEREFAANVRMQAKVYGWMEHVVYDSRRSPEGWPDLFFVRQSEPDALVNEAVAFECKTEKGKATPQQEHWLEMLSGVPGITAMLIRPSDIDKVVEVLL